MEALVEEDSYPDNGAIDIDSDEVNVVFKIYTCDYLSPSRLNL